MDKTIYATDGGEAGEHTDTDRRGSVPTVQRRSIRQGTKLCAVMRAFASGNSYNRFQAAQELHDHCLHSTVSTIQDLGIQVSRRRETVPCVRGTRTASVNRYWLETDEREKARALLPSEPYQDWRPERIQ